MSTIVSETKNFIVIDLGALAPKSFSTGSKGWFGTEKIALESGMYQCNWQVTLNGSKDDPTTPEPTAPFPAGTQALAAKDFKSGSKGYFAQGNVLSTFGKVHMQFQMVLIGSKPVSPEKIDKAEAGLAAMEAQLVAKRAAVEALKGRAAFDKLA